MVSIVIPTLNEATALPKLLAQFTLDLVREFDLELLVSDGGSTDETIAIARRFGVQVIEHKAKDRQTIAQGRNAGAAKAQGDILVFIDADTIIPNPRQWLRSMVVLFQRQVVVAATLRFVVAPAERTLADRWWQNVFNICFYLLNLVGIGMGRGNCQMIRTSAFKKVGGYHERLVAGEDFELFHRLLRLGKVKFMWRVVMYESPRRFRKYGYMRIIGRWLANFFSVWLRGKSHTEEWQPVRE